MERYLTNYILDDLKKKIVLLTGPRQSGKTTLSKMLSNNFDYLNFAPFPPKDGRNTD